MQPFLSSRIICGFSEFGPPPFLLLEFDVATAKRPDNPPSALLERSARLDASLGSSAGSVRRTDAIGVFEDFFQLLLTRAGCVATMQARRPGPGGKSIQLIFGCDHGRIAEKAASVAARLLFDQRMDIDAAVPEHIHRLEKFAASYRLEAGSLLLREAALSRNLPVLWLDQDPFNPLNGDSAIGSGLLQIGQGIRQRRAIGFIPMPAGTSLPVNVLDRQTLMTTLISNGLPVPEQDLDFPNKNSLSRLRRAADRIGYPVTIRPAIRPPFADWGGGVDSVGPIADSTGLIQAYEAEGLAGRRLWMEANASGESYRFIVIGGRVSTAWRGESGKSPSKPDAPVPPETFSSDIRALVETAARVVRLFELAAVEMAIVDPRAPAVRENCVITDVFPDPQVLKPPGAVDGTRREPAADETLASATIATARARAQAEALLDVLFPPGTQARIPILAVTGTNGKTTTSRMLARILRRCFSRVGLTNTDGAFVNEELLTEDESSGVAGGSLVLAEPHVDAAVLETARGDLLKRGTAFDACDVAICLNVSADHLGHDGIETLDQMAEVKGRLLKRATHAIVVNADDHRCLRMLESATCRRHVLVAESDSNSAVQHHLAAGGEAVFDEHGSNGPCIILARGPKRERLVEHRRIPATMNGMLNFNMINARHAAAAAWSIGIDADSIRSALEEFDHSHTVNPGRFNFFSGYAFKVLLDFAHNPVGVRGVLELIDRMDIQGKRHLVCLTIGARHKAHIDELVGDMAPAFDTFRLSCYASNVEANPEYSSARPVDEMLAYFQARLIDQGVASENVACHIDRVEAIRAGLALAEAGDLLLVLGHPEVAIPLLAAGQADTAQTKRHD